MKKNQRGFTLVEVIISIAILAVISGFILQMFVLASNQSKIMENKDLAFQKATMVVEIFRSVNSVSEDFPGELTGLGIGCERTYYDDQWQQVAGEDSTFIMDVCLTPMDDSVYELDVTVMATEDKAVYVDINTARYSPEGGLR